MLSRTADNLYWLARYVERADFLARIIKAAQRLATLPMSYSGTGTEWESALESSGAAQGFRATRGAAEEASVVDYLTFAPDNPSSIRNCIKFARANARAVRTALTAEMWEAINGAWIELGRFEASNNGSSRYDREELSRFFEFVKKTSLDYDGSVDRTMLRNDAYWFSRVGLYIERADNTARILDVKYHVLLPENEAVGGSVDYFQWTAILRAVSSLTAYHWVYRESVKPWLIADLLILKKEMPRSLIACYDNIVHFLDAIGDAYGRSGPSQKQAHEVLARLANATTNEIFKIGLHEFITAFVEDNDRLGERSTSNICNEIAAPPLVHVPPSGVDRVAHGRANRHQKVFHAPRSRSATLFEIEHQRAQLQVRRVEHRECPRIGQRAVEIATLAGDRDEREKHVPVRRMPPMSGFQDHHRRSALATRRERDREHIGGAGIVRRECIRLAQFLDRRGVILPTNRQEPEGMMDVGVFRLDLHRPSEDAPHLEHPGREGARGRRDRRGRERISDRGAGPSLSAVARSPHDLAAAREGPGSDAPRDAPHRPFRRRQAPDRPRHRPCVAPA